MPLPQWMADGAPGFIGLAIALVAYAWYLRERADRARRRRDRNELTPAE